MPLRIRIRHVLKGDLGRLMGAVAAFEVGNIAATLLILRATEGDVRRLAGLFGLSIQAGTRYTNTVDHPGLTAVETG